MKNAGNSRISLAQGFAVAYGIMLVGVIPATLVAYVQLLLFWLFPPWTTIIGTVLFLAGTFQAIKGLLVGIVVPSAIQAGMGFWQASVLVTAWAMGHAGVGPEAAFHVIGSDDPPTVWQFALFFLDAANNGCFFGLPALTGIAFSPIHLSGSGPLQAAYAIRIMAFLALIVMTYGFWVGPMFDDDSPEQA